MTGMWEFAGNLDQAWSMSRFVVIFFAAIYGLILGWMVFPRVGKLDGN